MAGHWVRVLGNAVAVRISNVLTWEAPKALERHGWEGGLMPDGGMSDTLKCRGCRPEVIGEIWAVTARG